MFKPITSRFHFLLLLSATAILAQVPLVSAQSPAIDDALREGIYHLTENNESALGGAKVASAEAIEAFYQSRSFVPVWTTPDRIDDLLQAIGDTETDGLLPRDYHLSTLQQLRSALADGAGPAQAADFEILLTDALLRLVYHTLVGKVDPERLDHDWNMSYQIRGADPIAAINTMLESGNLYTQLRQLKPAHPSYQRLKMALADYRRLAASGGWPGVDAGEVLKPEMSDARVTQVRRRLAASGDFRGDPNDPGIIYDLSLEKAVKRFQTRHGLEVDGVIGPATLAAMNVPVEARIDQLRVNLERSRWVLQDVPTTFIVVNIAGFEVYLIRDGQRIWQTRAVVGSNYHQSPVFKADLEYLVFNPTWTIPRSITVKEMLPAVKRNRNYLRARDIEVIDSKGRSVNQSTINWGRYNGRNFPYTLRQKPGTKNALGQVKFIFPNKHSVFLHDTPSKSLFSKSQRNFSHGCIRVENPLKLAELILNDTERWNADAIEQVLSTGKLKNVSLETPIPVLLLYWTAQVGDDGTVYFLPDVYERDQAVLKNLNGEFRLRKRPLIDNTQIESDEDRRRGSLG